MLNCDYPKIHARHYLCEYHHATYRPHLFPFTFPAETRREWVLADSPEGALASVRYQHFLYSSGFRILEAPAP